MAAGLSVVFAQPAAADIFDTLDSALSTIQSGFEYIWPDDIDVADFDFRLGAGIGVVPDYEGSDNYRLRIVPLIDVRYKDRLSLQGTKFRINVLQSGAFKAGPLIAYRFGRDEGRNRVLEGLGDVNGAMQVGAFAEIQTKSDLLISADIRQALGNSQGLQANLVLGHGIYRSERFALGVGIQLKWMSGRANRTNFGITDAQSAASLAGLDGFTPGGGVNHASLNLLGLYRISKTVRLEGLLSYGRVLGDAADSPLVADVGNANQSIAGLGIRFSF